MIQRFTSADGVAMSMLIGLSVGPVAHGHINPSILFNLQLPFGPSNLSSRCCPAVLLPAVHPGGRTAARLEHAPRQHETMRCHGIIAENYVSRAALAQMCTRGTAAMQQLVWNQKHERWVSTCAACLQIYPQHQFHSISVIRMFPGVPCVCERVAQDAAMFTDTGAPRASHHVSI